MVVENTKPPLEMRKVIVPSEHHEQIPKKLERGTAPERSKLERTITSVLESEPIKAISETATLQISTHNPALALPTQEMPANPSASQGHHSSYKLSRAPSIVEDVPDLIQTQIELIQENQITILANQSNLERRMVKMEQLMLQILKALQKGKDNL